MINEKELVARLEAVLFAIGEPVEVTRIAQGISMGSELEYADEVTLSKALSDRKEM